MKRTSRRLFFHEIVDFSKRKRYFGGRVQKERSGRHPGERKTIPNVLTRFADLLHRPKFNTFATFRREVNQAGEISETCCKFAEDSPEVGRSWNPTWEKAWKNPHNEQV